MTALAIITRHDQNWSALIVVPLILLLLSAGEYAAARLALRRDQRRADRTGTGR